MVADLRTAKLGFEHSLDLLHAALSRLSAEKDNAREKIMMITLIQKQKLEKQQVYIGEHPSLHNMPFYCTFLLRA